MSVLKIQWRYKVIFMRNKCSIFYLPAALLLITLLSGCGINLAPRMTESEKKAMEENQYPFGTATIYNSALNRMGTTINSKISYRKIVQSKEIGNTAGGNELPFNLTNMVINSISEFSGPRLIVVPYDPQYIINDFQTGGKGTRVLPDVIIGGSITEFDKDIEGDSSGINLDMLISHHGTEADIGIGMGGSKKLSRVVLDLYLLDYKTHAVIPGMNVSNTIHVMEMDKDHDFGFAIWGSGMGIDGRIERKQGFHKAMRNLVEYSILQLFGKYYDLPYWGLIGMKTADPDVARSMLKTFHAKNHIQQVQEIQKWLQKYNLGPVTTSVHGGTFYRVPTDGFLDPVTQAFIKKFSEQYLLGSKADSLDEVYVQLVAHETFPTLMASRRPEDSAEIRESLSEQMGQTKDSENIILMGY